MHNKRPPNLNKGQGSICWLGSSVVLLDSLVCQGIGRLLGTWLTLARTTNMTQLCSICFSSSSRPAQHVLPVAVEGAPERENPKHRGFQVSVDATSVNNELAKAAPMAQPWGLGKTQQGYGQGHGRGGMKNGAHLPSTTGRNLNPTTCLKRYLDPGKSVCKSWLS